MDIRFFNLAAALVMVSFVSSAEETPSVLASGHPADHGDGGYIVSKGDSPFGISFATGWDSRYVSEGIDNLDGGGIWTVEGLLEYDMEHFALYVGGWYALGYDSDYDEVNILTGVVASVANFNFEFGYTYLNSPELGHNEIGGLIEYTGLGNVILGADWYYSFEADGSFINLFAAREFELTDRLTLEAESHLGINADYLAEGHDGFNHLFAGLRAMYGLTEHMTLRGHLGYNFAINSDPASAPDDELLHDFFHGGVSIGVSF